MSRVGETGVGEMGIGETGVDEMGVGETGPNLSYSHSFQTIRDSNDLSDSLISSAEMSVDCVSKYTSLVRAWDYKTDMMMMMMIL